MCRLQVCEDICVSALTVQYDLLGDGVTDDHGHTLPERVKRQNVQDLHTRCPFSCKIQGQGDIKGQRGKVNV